MDPAGPPSYFPSARRLGPDTRQPPNGEQSSSGGNYGAYLRGGGQTLTAGDMFRELQRGQERIGIRPNGGYQTPAGSQQRVGAQGNGGHQQRGGARVNGGSQQQVSVQSSGYPLPSLVQSNGIQSSRSQQPVGTQSTRYSLPNDVQANGYQQSVGTQPNGGQQTQFGRRLAPRPVGGGVNGGQNGGGQGRGSYRTPTGYGRY